MKTNNIIIDFEVASKKKLLNHFPNAFIEGCLIHFSQIIWRRIQYLQLTCLYKSSYMFKNHIKLLLSLAFVPIEYVMEYYTILKEYIKKNDKINNYEMILEFFEKYYLKDIDIIKFWNVFDRVIGYKPRTINGLEGFHRALNNLFVKSHPDLGIFGEELLKESLVSSKKIIKALYQNGIKLPKKKHRTL